jgi:hypothetical protein
MRSCYVDWEAQGSQCRHGWNALSPPACINVYKCGQVRTHEHILGYYKALNGQSIAMLDLNATVYQVMPFLRGADLDESLMA